MVGRLVGWDFPANQPTNTFLSSRLKTELSSVILSSTVIFGWSWLEFGWVWLASPSKPPSYYWAGGAKPHPTAELPHISNFSPSASCSARFCLIPRFALNPTGYKRRGALGSKSDFESVSLQLRSPSVVFDKRHEPPQLRRR